MVESVISELDEACKEEDGVAEETGDSVLMEDAVSTLLLDDISVTTRVADDDVTAVTMDDIIVPVGVRIEVSVEPIVKWEEEIKLVKWGFTGSLEDDSGWEEKEEEEKEEERREVKGEERESEEEGDREVGKGKEEEAKEEEEKVKEEEEEKESEGKKEEREWVEEKVKREEEKVEIVGEEEKEEKDEGNIVMVIWCGVILTVEEISGSAVVGLKISVKKKMKGLWNANKVHALYTAKLLLQQFFGSFSLLHYQIKASFSCIRIILCMTAIELP